MQIAALAAEGMQVIENTFPPGLKPKTLLWLLGGAAKAAPFQSYRIDRINEFFRSLFSP
jgi:hypothetical protein